MKHVYPFLKNDTLTIRALEERDLEQFRTLRNDPDTAYFLTSVVPITSVKQQAWFQGVSKDDSRMYFAIEITDGTFVGLVRCDEWDKINQSIRIGVDIVSEKRRQGLATQVYTLLFDFLFHQLHIHRIWLFVLSYNTPALTLYKKLGFIEEGKQREAIFRDNTYHDYIMMSLLSHEYEKS
jgi:diamine N-acetyltransferase